MESKIKEAIECPYRLRCFDELPKGVGSSIYARIKFRFDLDFDETTEIAEIRLLHLYAGDNIVDIVLIDRDGDAYCFPTYDTKIKDFVF